VWSAKPRMVEDDAWGPFFDLAHWLQAFPETRGSSIQYRWGGIGDGVEGVAGDHLDRDAL
jgi:hypothetical protein